jgi:hypothetical protein
MARRSPPRLGHICWSTATCDQRAPRIENTVSGEILPAAYRSAQRLSSNIVSRAARELAQAIGCACVIPPPSSSATRDAQALFNCAPLPYSIHPCLESPFSRRISRRLRRVCRLSPTRPAWTGTIRRCPPFFDQAFFWIEGRGQGGAPWQRPALPPATNQKSPVPNGAK